MTWNVPKEGEFVKLGSRWFTAIPTPNDCSEKSVCWGCAFENDLAHPENNKICAKISCTDIIYIEQKDYPHQVIKLRLLR